ncbi:hypothetical protein NDU88_001019 [Pleurodeles waltl]|uniref:Uncharacterized protein n=1 Tax=Pleurodeles waltl TaxID=8319 RepID=A0AAV7R9V1_PLEWA|nr:hypothetical protein NDU88_001019 [Pleurodeles waltl]
MGSDEGRLLVVAAPVVGFSRAADAVLLQVMDIFVPGNRGQGGPRDSLFWHRRGGLERRPGAVSGRSLAEVEERGAEELW